MATKPCKKHCTLPMKLRININVLDQDFLSSIWSFNGFWCFWLYQKCINSQVASNIEVIVKHGKKCLFTLYFSLYCCCSIFNTHQTMLVKTGTSGPVLSKTIFASSLVKERIQLQCNKKYKVSKQFFLQFL